MSILNGGCKSSYCGPPEQQVLLHHYMWLGGGWKLEVSGMHEVVISAT